MPRDAVETDVYLLFNIGVMEEHIDEGILDSLKEAGDEMRADAKARFNSKVGKIKQGPRNARRRYSKSTGEMAGHFFDWESRYSHKFGGWLVGLAGRSGNKWENSLGGKAHFFEYGRSAPGKGKAHGGPQSVRTRAQKPRPFLRPAKNKMKRKLGGITSQELRRAAKRMNRDPVLNRNIMSIANRIA